MGYLWIRPVVWCPAVIIHPVTLWHHSNGGGGGPHPQTLFISSYCPRFLTFSFSSGAQMHKALCCFNTINLCTCHSRIIHTQRWTAFINPCVCIIRFYTCGNLSSCIISTVELETLWSFLYFCINVTHTNPETRKTEYSLANATKTIVCEPVSSVTSVTPFCSKNLKFYQPCTSAWTDFSPHLFTEQL